MILLRPFHSAIKIRQHEYRTQKTAVLRDTLVLFLLFTFSLLIFFGSRWVLKEISKDTNFILIPEIPLIFSFNIFFPMIFFTALSGVISQFFTSEDLELLLASPISKIKFFFQRYLIVAIETSWMSIISILPFLLSFTTIYHASGLYYVLIPLYLLLFLLIPSALALLFGIIWALIIPRIPGYILITGALLTGIVLFNELITLISQYLENTDSFNPNVILSAMDRFTNFGSHWSPATWMAQGLAPFLSVSEVSAHKNHSLLYYKFLLSVLASFGLLGFVSGTAYILHLYLYHSALSQVWGRQKKVLTAIRPPQIFRKPVFIPQRIRRAAGAFKKEALEFVRDPSQLIQTFFLLSIIALYIYLLRFQQNLYPLIQGLQKDVWEKALLLIHLTLECFIIVAMMTRLLFPSISREGRSIWILQCSPITSREIILYKYLFFCIPISVLVGFLSGVSFYLQFNNTLITTIKIIISVSMTTTIGALAVFLGSRFAQFTWESRSQLVASFGSLIFMVSGLMLAGFSIILSIPLFESLRKDTTISSLHVLLLLLILLTNLSTCLFLLKKAGISLHKKLRSLEV